jgi:hypothetical protein
MVLGERGISGKLTIRILEMLRVLMILKRKRRRSVDFWK